MNPNGIDEGEWKNLLDALEKTIPIYDKVNRLATLGLDKGWRKKIRSLLPADGVILEVGSGPGTFAESVQNQDLTCLDPSPVMIAHAAKRVDHKREEKGLPPIKWIEASAEDIPAPDNSFDAVCCLFSFRDFQDKEKGLSEILRVLKPGGRLLVCDLGKASIFHGWFGVVWLKIVVGTIARFVAKTREHPFKLLGETYRHFGTLRYYKRMARQVGYCKVKGRLLLPFGMAELIVATKPGDNE